MKYKHKDEQQHELMFNLDEDASHTRSCDSTKVLPSLNKSEVTAQSQNLHDSHEVTPFHPNSPRWTTRQSNPHEWYHHKISNATAEISNWNGKERMGILLFILILMENIIC